MHRHQDDLEQRSHAKRVEELEWIVSRAVDRIRRSTRRLTPSAATASAMIAGPRRYGTSTRTSGAFSAAVATSTRGNSIALAATTPKASSRPIAGCVRLARANVNVTFVDEIEPADQPGGEIAAARPDGAARDVSNETQSREEQHERPELAWPDAAERTVGARRQQRQDHQRHHAEPHRRPERHVVDARDHRV